jgi:hypothetical protein
MAFFFALSAPAASLPPLKISADRRAFVSGDKAELFRPRGFNYDRDYKMRLLEDYWDSDWETVVGDFREMKALGANVVRIHFQLAKFMDSPTKANRHSIQQLKKLLRLAEETGLYLDLTGLACYRKADVPAWFAILDEQKRWETQANFWSAIAKASAHSSAVFCYDLINEPVVPDGKSSEWLVGQLAGFYYVQAISLDRGDRSRSAVSVAWTTKMRQAIRRYDKTHFITIGLLPDSADSPSSSGFIPRDLAPLLDFISVHLYPHSKQRDRDLATLRLFAVGKPLVIEETFPMGCSSVELKQFLEASRSIANGWISFYWGETPAELEHSHSIAASILLDWLKRIAELNTADPVKTSP